MSQKRTIVAEVAVNWTESELGGHPKILAERFEAVIAHNEGRGYRLRDWRMTSTPYGGALAGGMGGIVETIVAVFELEDR